MGNTVIRYSEAFRHQVVSELESGKLRSLAKARQVYGINGATTLHRWIRKYGKNHLLGKVIRVETVKERDQVKELKKRIRDLEKAVADAKVKEVVSQAYFEVACEKFGITDIEEFKKKAAIQLSRKGC